MNLFYGFNFGSADDLLLTFNTEEKCIAYLEQKRWGGRVVCPHCGHSRVYRTNVGFKCASPLCYKKFSILTRTPIEGTNIPLQKWFLGIYLVTTGKGVSSIALGKALGVHQGTAWRMINRMRKIFEDE